MSGIFVMRRLLVVGACAAALLLDVRRPARAASAEDCGEFHRECTEARAAGYRDVGICNVERLECPLDRAAGAPNGSPDVQDDDGEHPDRSFGEPSVGP